MIIVTGKVIGFLAIYTIVILGFNFFIYFLKEKHELVVYLNIFLMFVVFIEPAPSDIIFAFIVLFMWQNSQIDFSKLKKQTLTLSCYYIFIILNIIPIFSINNHLDSIEYFVITLYLLAYSIFIFVFSNQKNYSKVFKVYVYSSSLASVFAIVGYLGKIGFLMYDSYRVKSLFKDPNVFGPYLVPAVIILLDDILRNNIASRKLNVFLLFINTVGIVLSFSRGSWLNLAVSVIFYLLLNINRLKLRRILMYSAITLLILLLIWSFFLENDFKDFFMQRTMIQGYDNDRFSVQESGLSLVSNRLIGYGPGVYEEIVMENFGLNVSAHNLYIRVMLENGIIGFTFFIIPLIYILTKLLKRHVTNDMSKVDFKSSILLSIIIGIAVNSFVIDTLHWRHLWLFIGLGLSVANENYEGTKVRK